MPRTKPKNCRQNDTQKTKDWVIQTQLKTEDEYRFLEWYDIILLKHNSFLEINSREHMVDEFTPTFVVNFYRQLDGALQHKMTHGANTYCWKWRLTLAHSLAEVKSTAQLLFYTHFMAWVILIVEYLNVTKMYSITAIQELFFTLIHVQV